MTGPSAIIAAMALGYLLGSIPFGVVFSRLAGLGDVRAQGSGNIGATNMLRLGNKPLAIATLLADAAKGTIAVLIVTSWGEYAVMAAALGALLGHIFPLWLKFRGGKGVATYLGTLLGAAWPVGLAFIAVWIMIALLSRISSLSALVAASATPMIFIAIEQPYLAAIFMCMSIVVFLTHSENIQRLIAGKEPKIGVK